MEMKEQIGATKTVGGETYQLTEKTPSKPRWTNVLSSRLGIHQKKKDGVPVKAALEYKPRRWNDVKMKHDEGYYKVRMTNHADHKIFDNGEISGKGQSEAEAISNFHEALKQNQIEGAVSISKSLFYRLFQ